MQIHPVVPVRDMVVFPGVIAPLFVGRPRSARAIEEANTRGHLVFITAQKNSLIENPDPDDLNTIGTLCKILQTVRMPDGTIKAVLEGGWRCRAVHFITGDSFLEAEIEKIPSTNTAYTNQTEALRRAVLSEFEQYVKLNLKLPDEVSHSVENIEDTDLFADIVASHSLLKHQDKQKLLETPDLIERLRRLLGILMRENEFLKMEHEIQDKVRNEMDKGQKQYYLREQLKIIQQELGEDGPLSEAEELRSRAEDTDLPEEARERVMRELERYARMAPISPEATVARTYIEWLLDLPWNVFSEDHLNLKDARKILEEDHYGLEEVKERILEFLAVRKLAADNMRAQVLCFVGPPGVGKTSLGKSIARTMGRKFVNMSLGGLRDEAEIRGHRRTYVGALPGRIIQKIKAAGTNNPVLLMDEIDKIGTDFRGDPAAALLEVLDPEQNCSFTDNFLEISFDLSKVMFITTANSTGTIPRPLLDRMEIIPIPGYVAEEKVKIAKKHLLPRILREHGLEAKDMIVPEATIRNIITLYTMEAGVRNLDRQLSKLARKVAAEMATSSPADKPETPIRITKDVMKKMLGAPKLHTTRIPKEDPLGTAIGLAWTETGGSVILIESAVMEGSGNVTYTGNLGDIMQESAQTALAYLRSNAEAFGIENIDWKKKDIHIHVPEGAVPKDGPSAGITLALSLCSALTGRKVDASYAMTGEMTLHGNVLPIGGIREKILAAKRHGIKKLILPEDNRPDVEELSDWIKSGMKIHYVSKMSTVFQLALK
ncbi:MAG TPA: endopeptidase La [Synergistaceae bacterium]|jgi:ATP-dependent Lon protease|nr:endopeptidase La [Synergistaceae bacterium]HPX03413.1 endopeptidase La [Synergistaceae bacterium]HQA54428.1 endopeptidase La [Synergistaceae bacterium]